MASPVTADVLDSPAVGILGDLERDGFRVELTPDGVLMIAPRSRLTLDRMQAVAACKDALKVLLRCCDDGVGARRDLFTQQLAQTPAPGVPAFLFLAGIGYGPGVCFSCGDGLPGLQFGRCWRCALAWRLAAGVSISSALAEALDGARVCA